MNKSLYLEKLGLARSDVRMLIGGTRAGAMRVHLETVEEYLTKMYEQVADMKEDYFIQWVRT